MKTKYNELKEKCRPFLEALEHFPEVAKLFTEKVKQLFSFKEEQERAEKEAREKKDKSVPRHEETSGIWRDNHFHYTHDLMTS